jgi:hypothetical protein
MSAFAPSSVDDLSGQTFGRLATATKEGLPDVAVVRLSRDGDDIVTGGIDATKTVH